MAELFELNDEARDWIASRPKVIQGMIAKVPPNRLYRMKSTGSRVTLHSYSEDGTVTVDISGNYNLVTFERQVFGIPIDDLEECGLPHADEVLGVMLDDRQTADFINERRAENGLPPLELDGAAQETSEPRT